MNGEAAASEEVVRQVKQSVLSRLDRDRRGVTRDVKAMLDGVAAQLYDHALDVSVLVAEASSSLVGESVSRSTALWRFRHQLGHDPQTYADSLRVQAAYRLVCETDMLVADMSDCLGFSDPADFGRWFKRRTGRSPRALRRLETRQVETGDGSGRKAPDWPGLTGRRSVLGVLSQSEAATWIRSLKEQLEVEGR